MWDPAKKRGARLFFSWNIYQIFKWYSNKLNCVRGSVVFGDRISSMLDMCELRRGERRERKNIFHSSAPNTLESSSLDDSRHRVEHEMYVYKPLWCLFTPLSTISSLSLSPMWISHSSNFSLLHAALMRLRTQHETLKRGFQHKFKIHTPSINIIRRAVHTQQPEIVHWGVMSVRKL